MFKFNYSKYTEPPGAYFRGGGLYIENVFRFKSWFLNAPGDLYTVGAYYRNFTVYIKKRCSRESLQLCR